MLNVENDGYEIEKTKDYLIPKNSRESNTVMLDYLVQKIKDSKKYKELEIKENWKFFRLSFISKFFSFPVFMSCMFFVTNEVKGDSNVNLLPGLGIAFFIAMFITIISTTILYVIGDAVKDSFSSKDYLKRQFLEELGKAYNVKLDLDTLNTPEGLGKLISLLEALSDNDLSDSALKRKKIINERTGFRIHNFSQALISDIKQDGVDVDVCAYYVSRASSIYLSAHNKKKSQDALKEKNAQLEVLWS